MPTAGDAHIVAGEYPLPACGPREKASVGESRINFACAQPLREFGDVDGNNINPDIRRDLLERCHDGGKKGYLADVGHRQAKPPAREMRIEFARTFNRPLD